MRKIAGTSVKREVGCSRRKKGLQSAMLRGQPRKVRQMKREGNSQKKKKGGHVYQRKGEKTWSLVKRGRDGTGRATPSHPYFIKRGYELNLKKTLKKRKGGCRGYRRNFLGSATLSGPPPARVRCPPPKKGEHNTEGKGSRGTQIRKNVSPGMERDDLRTGARNLLSWAHQKDTLSTKRGGNRKERERTLLGKQ